MAKIKIKAPAKINFSLKVGKRREDGFHSIESFMQAINLYDILKIETDDFGHGIKLSGTSDEIPYDNSNLVWKACELYFKKAGMDLKEKSIYINIEKNIPVCAGLAGGSTDAAAALFGLNLIYEKFDSKGLHELCAELGSDLNFCLEGGAKICKGRGEILEEAEFKEMPITLVKPLNLKISAKEAYQRFDELKILSTMPNDLEFALLPHYEELQVLHNLGFQMSGSGPSFFKNVQNLDEKLKENLGKGYLIKENLKTVNHGIMPI